MSYKKRLLKAKRVSAVSATKTAESSACREFIELETGAIGGPHDTGSRDLAPESLERTCPDLKRLLKFTLGSDLYTNAYEYAIATHRYVVATRPRLWRATCLSQCQEINKMLNRTLSLYVRLQTLRSSLRKMAASQNGQDLIEYALVVALIAFAAAAGMSSVASNINAAFTNIGTKLTTYTS